MKTDTLTPLLLTARQAADALAISPRKLWQLTKDREVPHVRLGRSVRYPAEDLRQWIARNQTGGDV